MKPKLLYTTEDSSGGSSTCSWVVCDSSFPTTLLQDACSPAIGGKWGTRLIISCMTQLEETSPTTEGRRKNSSAGRSEEHNLVMWHLPVKGSCYPPHWWACLLNSKRTNILPNSYLIIPFSLCLFPLTWVLQRKQLSACFWRGGKWKLTVSKIIW